MHNSRMNYASAACLVAGDCIMLFCLAVVDSYVVVGCHYDSWTYGGVDPSTGIAILMELVKAFDKLLTQGWMLLPLPPPCFYVKC